MHALFLDAVATKDQGHVVQRVDSIIHWVNYHPMIDGVGFAITSSVDWNLSAS